MGFIALRCDGLHHGLLLLDLNVSLCKTHAAFLIFSPPAEKHHFLMVLTKSIIACCRKKDLCFKGFLGLNYWGKVTNAGWRVRHKSVYLIRFDREGYHGVHGGSTRTWLLGRVGCLQCIPTSAPLSWCFTVISTYVPVRLPQDTGKWFLAGHSRVLEMGKRHGVELVTK